MPRIKIIRKGLPKALGGMQVAIDFTTTVNPFTTLKMSFLPKNDEDNTPYDVTPPLAPKQKNVQTTTTTTVAWKPLTQGNTLSGVTSNSFNVWDPNLFNQSLPGASTNKQQDNGWHAPMLNPPAAQQNNSMFN